MLNTSEQQFLEAVQGWMAEPRTKTYLASNKCEHLAGTGAIRVSRMSEELKSALIQAGVEPPAKEGNGKQTLRDNLARQMPRRAANDEHRGIVRSFS